MSINAGYIYAVATADTKGRELFYVSDCIAKTGADVLTVDLSTQPVMPSEADFPPELIADFHPDGRNAVFAATAAEPLMPWRWHLRISSAKEAIFSA